MMLFALAGVALLCVGSAGCLSSATTSAELQLYDVDYDEFAESSWRGSFAADGYEYMTADVAVVNTGETRLTASSSDFYVADTAGRHFEPDRSLTRTYPDGLELTTVRPGETYRFHLVAEVPQGEELTLVYEDSKGPLAVWHLPGKKDCD